MRPVWLQFLETGFCFTKQWQQAKQSTQIMGLVPSSLFFSWSVWFLLFKIVLCSQNQWMKKNIWFSIFLLMEYTKNTKKKHTHIYERRTSSTFFGNMNQTCPKFKEQEQFSENTKAVSSLLSKIVLKHEPKALSFPNFQFLNLLWHRQVKR